MKTKLMFFAAFVGLMFFAGCETPSQPYNPGGGGGGGEGGGSGTGTTVQAPKYVQIATSGGSSTIDIQSVLPWTATANKSWISLDPEKGGMGKTEVTITIIAGEQEQGEIDFRASNGNITKMKVYRGIDPEESGEPEDPADPGDPEDPEEGGNISETLTGPYMIIAGRDDAEFTMTISSETDWELIENIDWLTFTPTEGEAGTDIVISVQAQGGHDAEGIIYVHNKKDKISFPAYRGYLPSEGDYDVAPTVFPTKIEGCLPGLFRISRTQQVYFSKGNLHYFKGNWSFAAHQWEYNLEGNGEVPKADTKPMDFFGWGTSGWNSGAEAYLPTSDSQNYMDYTPGGDPKADLTGAYAKADWGVYNAISNGGNEPGLWRVLTVDEWLYVIRQRPHWGDLSATAIVEGIPGFILLPDNWDWKKWDGKLDSRYGDFIHNVLSASDFEQFAQDGAVFFPGEGDPYWGKVYGTYWSSSVENRPDYARSAAISSLGSQRFDISTTMRYLGCSVRLVRVD